MPTARDIGERNVAACGRRPLEFEIRRENKRAPPRPRACRDGSLERASVSRSKTRTHSKKNGIGVSGESSRGGVAVGVAANFWAVVERGAQRSPRCAVARHSGTRRERRRSHPESLTPPQGTTLSRLFARERERKNTKKERRVRARFIKRKRGRLSFASRGTYGRRGTRDPPGRGDASAKLRRAAESKRDSSASFSKGGGNHFVAKRVLSETRRSALELEV